jgi:hypothetical protein
MKLDLSHHMAAEWERGVILRKVKGLNSRMDCEPRNREMDTLCAWLIERGKQKVRKQRGAN